MTLDASFWSAMAFFVFFALGGRSFWRILTESLDGRSEKIRDDIGSAEQEKSQAKTQLQNAMNGEKDHEQSLKRISDHGDATLGDLRAQAKESLEWLEKRTQKQLEQYRDYHRQKAHETLKNRVIQDVISSLQNHLETHHTKEKDGLFIQNALNDLETLSPDAIGLKS